MISTLIAVLAVQAIWLGWFVATGPDHFQPSPPAGAPFPAGNLGAAPVAYRAAPALSGAA